MKSAWIGSGFSHHSVPSLSNTATRSSTGSSETARSTNATIASPRRTVVPARQDLAHGRDARAGGSEGHHPERMIRRPGCSCERARGDAGDGRARARRRQDLDSPSDGSMRSWMPARPAPRVGSRVEAASGVVDAERQLVAFAPQADRHGGAAAGVLGRVLDGLEAAEVDGDLDLGCAAADAAGGDPDRDRRCARTRPSARPSSPCVASSGGETPLRDAPQLVADALGLAEKPCSAAATSGDGRAPSAPGPG